MKTFNIIVKILAALAAITGVVYIIATYGDKIVSWAKGLLNRCPCCCEGDCENCDCEGDCTECECEDCCGDCEEEVEVEVEEAPAEEAEEAPAEEAEEAPAEETEVAPVAEESDFEG